MNCGNQVAENGREKKKKRIMVAKIWGGIKKKKVLHLQYFHNKSQVISCYYFKFEFNTEITF